MIKKIINLLNERQLLQRQYLDIKVLSTPLDFKEHLNIYNLILIYNKKTYNWESKKVNELFNSLLKRGLSSTDLYMTFIFKYEKINKGEFIGLKNLAQSIRNLNYSSYSIHDLKVELNERINQLKEGSNF